MADTLTTAVASLDVQDTVLDTGLRVIVARRPSAPVVHVRLGIPFGGTDPAHAATAELLGATLLGGSTGRDRAAIDDALADVGGTLRVNVRPERLKVTGQVLADGLPQLLNLLTGCLTAATFPAQDMATEHARLLGQVRLADTLPQYVARASLLRHCYGEHPASREVPTVADLTGVGREAVSALRDSHLVPGGAVLVLVGDVHPAAALDEVVHRMSAWQGEHPAHCMPVPPPVPKKPVAFISRDGAQQASVRLAGPALSRTDPMFPALHLANHVFGGYFSARLTQNLREHRGWIYFGSSAIEERVSGGTIVVQFGATPTHAWDAINETMTELDRIGIAAPPTATEIAAARGHSCGSQSISLSTQEGLVEGLYLAAVIGLGHDWLSGYESRLYGVTDDEVRAAAAIWLRPEAYTGVVVGPESTRP